MYVFMESVNSDVGIFFIEFGFWIMFMDLKLNNFIEIVVKI